MRMPSDLPILTAAEMRALEADAFAAGVSQDALMERAGAAVAREASRFAQGRAILVLAGPGNNGGHAYVAARRLRALGHDVTVAALGATKPGAAARMRALWDGPVVPFDAAQGRAVLVDGLFGTGVTRPLEAEVVAKLGVLQQAAAFTLSIDVPSGFDSDLGDDLGSPLRADATVVFGALRPVHVAGPAAGRCGMLLFDAIGLDASRRWQTLARPKIAAPAPDSNKYSRGLVVVLSGAMPGAARLAARAALHAGAGYVVLASDGELALEPAALVHRNVAEAGALAKLLDDERIAALVVGPGLGRDARARRLLDAAIASAHPLVLDGDALSLLGETISTRLAGRTAVTWLTPHTGEFERLFGHQDGSKIARTVAAASACGAVVVHKGHDSVIAAPDGHGAVAAGGSSWLSTAGTGDVLAGTLGARIRPTADPLRAAAEAVWLHGRAAALAGPAFAADALVAQLPAAIGECL